MLALFSPFITSAQIVSETSSESDTGGNNAPSGGTVKTGNSSASSHTTTVMDGGVGTVEITTEVEENGEEYTNTTKKEVQGAIEVKASSGASSGGEAETSISVKTIQSSVASSTFWNRFKPFFQISTPTTTEVQEETTTEKPERFSKASLSATSSVSIAINSFVERLLNVLIFWR